MHQGSKEGLAYYLDILFKRFGDAGSTQTHVDHGWFSTSANVDKSRANAEKYLTAKLGITFDKNGASPEIAANLASAYDKSSEDNRNAQWYANESQQIADRIESQGFTHDQACAMVAACSPNLAWDYAQRERMPNLEIATAIGQAVQANAAVDISAENARAMNAMTTQQGASVFDPPVSEFHGNFNDLRADVGARMVSLGAGIAVYPDAAQKALSIARGDLSPTDLSGNKVTSFYQNLRDPSDQMPVTVDTWAIRGALGVDTPMSVVAHVMSNPGAYDLVADHYRALAATRGIVSNQAQAVVWNVVSGRDH